MLGQWKLFAAGLAAVVIASLFPQTSFAFEQTIKGTGIPRSERDCLESLPQFKSRLTRLGLNVASPMSCEEVLGENDAYSPAFVLKSTRNLTAITAAGQLYGSRESCNKTLAWMVRNVADANEAIVEAGCVEVSVVDQYEDEMRDGQFQPMVILLRDKGPAVAAPLAARSKSATAPKQAPRAVAQRSRQAEPAINGPRGIIPEPVNVRRPARSHIDVDCKISSNGALCTGRR